MPPKRTAKKPPPRKKPDKSWHKGFLKAFSLSGNVLHSCRSAGVTRSVAYEHREKYEDFAAAWEEAKEDAIENLESVARDRAIEQSDTLMIFLLKSMRPETYRERRDYAVKVKDSGVMISPGVESEDDWTDEGS